MLFPKPHSSHSSLPSQPQSPSPWVQERVQFWSPIPKQALTVIGGFNQTMWCCGVQSIDEMLPASGEVHEIRDEVEFDNKVKNKDSRFHKVVVFFNAVWCPPCRMIKTDFMELAQTHKHEEVLFLEVNIDKSRGISNACNVQSLPTFLCFNKGEMVEEVIGCDKARLLDAVSRLINLPSTLQTVPELHSPVDRFGPHSFKKMFKKILNL